MKKNWISVVSLVLNVVLLVFVVGLAAKLERTEENLRSWIGHVEDEVQESRDAVVSRVESLPLRSRWRNFPWSRLVWMRITARWK